MAPVEYISHLDPRVEPPVPDEDGKISELQNLVKKMINHNFSHHRHGFRGTHVKTQGVVKGTLEVASGLPAHLAQGLFAHPGTYPVAIRYANEPTFLQDDRAPGPRGLGMKVFNVEHGPFLDPVGERTKTQDFTFNNAPILELRDLPTAVEIFRIREANFNDGDGLKKALEERPDKDIQFAPASLPNQHFVSYTMYSQSAFRYGDYVVKYALFPTGKLQQELEKQKINDSSDPEQHSAWLREFFQHNSAEYDFRVQLLVDPAQQSVEDTTMQWDKSKFPFETVGKVAVPAGQDSFDAARRTFWEDRVKLNTWYGLEAHAPLGSVNRLRKSIYQTSVAERSKLNANEVLEIKNLDQIP